MIPKLIMNDLKRTIQSLPKEDITKHATMLYESLKNNKKIISHRFNERSRDGEKYCIIGLLSGIHLIDDTWKQKVKVASEFAYKLRGEHAISIEEFLKDRYELKSKNKYKGNVLSSEEIDQLIEMSGSIIIENT